MSNTRPLLYLDVEGVLHPYAAARPRPPAGYVTYWMRPAGWVGPARKPLRVWLNPEHGACLLALPYELVWATTWAQKANWWIGPTIGLPALRVVEWPEGADDVPRGPDGVWWKTRHLVAHAAGRPFAWVDDDIGGGDRRHVAATHPGPALLHHVNPATGLRQADFAALSRWAASLAGGTDS